MRNLYLEKKNALFQSVPIVLFSEKAMQEAAPSKRIGNSQKPEHFWARNKEPKVYEWLLKRFIANRIQ